MDPRLYMLAGTFALLVIALIATIVTAVRAARQRRSWMHQPPIIGVQRADLPVTGAGTIDTSLEGLELGPPLEGATAELLAPLRIGDWQPPEKDVSIGGLSELSLAARVESYPIPADRHVSQPAPASVPAPAPESVPAPAPESAPVPAPTPVVEHAPQAAPPAVVVAPAPILVPPSEPVHAGFDLPRIPEVMQDEMALRVPPVVPEVANVPRAPKVISLPEVYPVEPSTAAAPAPVPAPVPAPASVSVPGVAPSPTLSVPDVSVSAELVEPLPSWANLVPEVALEPVTSVSGESVAAVTTEDELAVFDLLQWGMLDDSVPTTEPEPASAPAFREPEPVQIPTLEPESAPVAALTSPGVWDLMDSVPDAFEPEVPDALPADAFWDAMFTEPVASASDAIPAIPAEVSAPEPESMATPAEMPRVAPATVAAAEPVSIPESPAPTQSQSRPAAGPTVVRTAIAPPPKADSISAPPSVPVRERPARPRTVVRSLFMDEGFGAASSALEPLAASPVPPERPAKSETKFEEIVMAAPVEMWFGESRVGVKAGTRTYTQFRKYADVLFADLKAAKTPRP